MMYFTLNPNSDERRLIKVIRQAVSQKDSDKMDEIHAAYSSADIETVRQEILMAEYLKGGAVGIAIPSVFVLFFLGIAIDYNLGAIPGLIIGGIVAMMLAKYHVSCVQDRVSNLQQAIPVKGRE